MAISELILIRDKEETKIIYDKAINFIEDLSLSKELSTENIKNEDSDLKILSKDSIQISDVIQIKINLTNVGCFLANFDKNTFLEGDRKALLNELSKLKNKVVPTQETQEKKFISIISIISKYNPIYVTFSNTGSLKMDVTKLFVKPDWNYPLLITIVPPKKPSIVERIKQKGVLNTKYFKGEYFFTTVFSILFSVAVLTGIHQLLNNENVGKFLIILAAAFVLILGWVDYTTIIKDNKENDNKLKYAILVYGLLGSIIGIVIGFVLSKFVLTKEETTLDITKMFTISTPIAAVVPMLLVFLPKPISKLMKKK